MDIARVGRAGVIIVVLLALAAVAFVTFDALGYSRTTFALFALGLGLGAIVVSVVTATMSTARSQ
jgi:hypothetical protein